MKTSSAKAKGRKLQQWVRDSILKLFPSLTPDDVRSTSMGAGGEDVQLSDAALRKFPYAVECKSHAKFAVYGIYDQAVEHSRGGKLTPLVVIKANRRKPLVVLDAEDFFKVLESTFDRDI